MAKCKLSSKILPALCAWLLLLGCTILFFTFTCPYLIKEYHICIAVYQVLLTIFVITNFGFSTFMDPGIYPKASNELVKDGDLPVPLHKTVEINNVTVRMKWCSSCKFYRPPRSSHCSICDCCIEVFDHHCPWMNNCIGRRNYRYFFQFLLSLTIHMASIFAFCVLYVINHNNNLKSLENIISMFLMVVIGLLSIPIIGLTCFHIVLICRSRTTNEQVTGKLRGTENPFDNGCLNNCCHLFCGPSWPGMLRGKRWVGGSKALSLSAASYNTSDHVVKVYMHSEETSKSHKDYNRMQPIKGETMQVPLIQHPPPPHQQFNNIVPSSYLNNNDLHPSRQQKHIYTTAPQHQHNTKHNHYNYPSVNSIHSNPSHSNQHMYYQQQEQLQHQQLLQQQQQSQLQMQHHHIHQPKLFSNDVNYTTPAYPSVYTLQQQQQLLQQKQLNENNVKSPSLAYRQFSNNPSARNTLDGRGDPQQFYQVQQMHHHHHHGRPDRVPIYKINSQDSTDADITEYKV